MLKQLETLDKLKGCGLDHIGPKLLKLSAPVLARPITKIFSIAKGEFPLVWKEARVPCLHKGGDVTEKSNYIPISVLPTLSKIIGRHVSNSIFYFLESHNLLSINQSGFKKMHNCETALLKVTQNWNNSLNHHESVGIAALDFRRAFDLVSHEIMREKLKIYSFSPNALNWMDSYLRNRTQRVAYGNELSKPSIVKCGVPHGSILGPLHFIIFINDIFWSVMNSELNLNADDSILHFSGSNVEDINTKLNEDVGYIFEWCSNNNMVINAKKSCSMLVSTTQRLAHQDVTRLSIKINNDVLSHVSKHKFGDYY